ncbi:hypothetical protein L1787_16625 [Acuticoccus sp. M5D2P5]|uniref:hypothetical protein n=1 Tax=Acuticoccus kalidii TaxID=2910977 RepID=UPI001F3CE4A2|nr:hypothetical protein [Acuticoccus kalidii]MCF3935030.1 hypothetical protein [Acuticoccus kalidii]
MAVDFWREDATRLHHVDDLPALAAHLMLNGVPVTRESLARFRELAAAEWRGW